MTRKVTLTYPFGKECEEEKIMSDKDHSITHERIFEEIKIMVANEPLESTIMGVANFLGYLIYSNFYPYGEKNLRELCERLIESGNEIEKRNKEK